MLLLAVGTLMRHNDVISWADVLSMAEVLSNSFSSHKVLAKLILLRSLACHRCFTFVPYSLTFSSQSMLKGSFFLIYVVQMAIRFNWSA